MADLRKIAVPICEGLLNQKSKAKPLCSSFLSQLVERESQEKVLEFFEIQLMHSNDVLVQFLDFFTQRFPLPKPQKVPQVDVSKAVPKQPEISVRHVEEASQNDSLQNSQ
jgi:hypothetical protein